MNLERYTIQVLREKGLELTQENVEIVKATLKRRLDRKYNAVCIGIDGTLLKTDCIDDETLSSIYKLLKKHISIVLMTGRGETGLKAFSSDLCSKLSEKFNVSQEILRNIIG